MFYKRCKQCGELFSSVRKDSFSIGANQFAKRKVCSNECSIKSRTQIDMFDCKDGVCYMENGVIFDEEDLVDFSRYHWYIDTMGYAIASAGKKPIRMHSMLMPPKKGLVVDHINRNQLDNRKSNLRYVTHRLNMVNRGELCVTPNGNSWVATVSGKYVGSYHSKEEAVAAVNERKASFFEKETGGFTPVSL